MSLTENDRERRIVAKRNNEKLKLSATFMNGCAIALVGAAVILPLVNDPTQVFPLAHVWWFVAACGIHYGARRILGKMASED